MRRLAALALAVLLVAAAALTGCAGSGDSSHVRVDAIFDNVAFLTEGQDLRIAGAKAGGIEKLSVTKDNKALVQLSVDKRFAPFRADADCLIEPQSLIGERFVNCTPGTASAPPLPNGPSGQPTVGLDHTHAPVDVDLILSTFQLPVRERGAILIGALGTGLAARGDDLNRAILRANPALQATRHTLAIVDGDRARLQRLITSSDAVLAALASRRDRVAAFVRDSATLLGASAGRRARLAAAIHGLPALLAQARPTLAEASRLARAGTPSVQALQRAAPGVNRLISQLEATAPQIRPTITALGRTAQITRRALPAIAPQMKRLRDFAAQAPAAGALVQQLFTSLRNSGAVEGLQSFAYFAAAATARFDKFSHMLPAYPLFTACSVSTAIAIPGCSAHLSSFAGAAAATKAAAPRSSRTIPRPPRGRSAGGVTTTASPTAAAPAQAPAAPPPGAGPVSGDLSTLLDLLLGR
jgi:ABC-type transporter Mla subunit MlaD